MVCQSYEIRAFFAGFKKKRFLARTGKDKVDFASRNGSQPFKQAQCIDCAARSGYPQNDPQSALPRKVVPLSEQSLAIIVEQRTARTL